MLVFISSALYCFQKPHLLPRYYHTINEEAMTWEKEGTAITWEVNGGRFLPTNSLSHLLKKNLGLLFCHIVTQVRKRYMGEVSMHYYRSPEEGGKT